MRLADAVGELVDDQTILILQRRRHALAFDARDLEAEGHDQRGVHRSRRQRLEPRNDLFARRARPCATSCCRAHGVAVGGGVPTACGRTGSSPGSARPASAAGIGAAGWFVEPASGVAGRLEGRRRD